MAPQTTPNADELETTPALGEATGPQKHGAGGMVGLLMGGQPGFDKPPPGTYKTYREMRTNPTIAMARVVATAPVRAAGHSVMGKDGVPDDHRDFIEEEIKTHWRHLLNQAMLALDYGWQSFEIVYEVRRALGGSSVRLGIDKFKPLWPDQTEIMEDKTTGAYAGIKQGKAVLPPVKTFRYSHDVEGTNWYGRSRHENVRARAYTGWKGTAEKMARYGQKIAGVIPVLMYPEGTGEDASGAKVSNFDLAVRMLHRLGTDMQGIAMPNAFSKWAGDLLNKGVDLAQLRPWLLQFHEPRGQHGGDFVTQLKYWDTQLARGWLTPERSFQEGQHGTKAEAGEHADIVLTSADETLMDLTDHLNRFVVDRLGAINFPGYTAGDIWIEPEKIVDADKAFLRAMIMKIAGGAGLAALLQILDLQTAIDLSGLPLDPEAPDDDDDDTIPIPSGDDDDEPTEPPDQPPPSGGAGSPEAGAGDGGG